MKKKVLVVENLSKKFCRNLKRSLWYGVHDLASEMLLKNKNSAKLRVDEFWALKDISFQLHKGETLGIIGHNGAGKSTLLKLINGLIKPDHGSIQIWGRVGALIELGTGFNPILTGRENIYVNAAVLGLTKNEVNLRINDIINFAEIGDFIDAPVQSYSSGMKVRLGFSIAANLNPEILIIDEILSVGDISFRQRCLDYLKSYKKKGGTIVFVSHNTIVVEGISDRVMLINRGCLAEIGEPGKVIQIYEVEALKLSQNRENPIGIKPSRESLHDVKITQVECYNMRGHKNIDFEFGDSFEVRISYETQKDISFPYFAVAIQKGTRQNPFTSMMVMLWDGISLRTIPRQGVVSCTITNPRFSPGYYHIHIGVLANPTSQLGNKWYAPLREYASLRVKPGRMRDCFPDVPTSHLVSNMPPVILDYSWKLDGRRLKKTEDE